MTDSAPFGPETLEVHEFLGGRLKISQPRDGFRSGVDAVFLAAAAPAKPGETVLELGAGAGVASFCLASRVGGLTVHALELQPDYADLAERNAESLELVITVHRGNVSAPPASLRGLTVDGVIANPPFFIGSDGAAPDSQGRAVARSETAPLADWIDCALRRLKPAGWLVLIQRTARLAEILTALEGRAGDVRIKPLAGRVDRDASRILVKARKGARAPLSLCPPLIEHKGASHLRDGDDYSAEASAILRHGGALDF